MAAEISAIHDDEGKKVVDLSFPIRVLSMPYIHTDITGALTRFLCAHVQISHAVHCSQTDEERRSTEQPRVAQCPRKEILSRFGVLNRVETSPYPFALPGTHRLPSLFAMSGPGNSRKGISRLHVMFTYAVKNVHGGRVVITFCLTGDSEAQLS